MRTVHIQLVNGTRFTLDAGACATVGQLRDLVSSSLPGGQAGQPVRLVASGRLLRNDAESLESCRVVDGCIVHAMVQPGARARGGTASHPTPTAPPPAAPEPPVDVVAMGLDRLVAIGAPRDQVETLRAVYLAEIQMIADRLPQQGDVSQHWRRAEDAFLAAQPCPHTAGPTEFVANIQPLLRAAAAAGRLPPVSCGMASASFLYGLFIGYLAGFWAMLFLTRTGPGRQYFLTGCLLGVMLHVAGPSLFDPVGPAPQPQPRGTDFTTNPPIALPPSLRGTTAPAGGR
ncbi:hypothetical protein FNF29_06793 [Cafeteria roenbergensis]|uniref:Ubiquitin-like domain-containing protein n=1 Tax=Cafeteria roenbergensis TaxID=33653 RepID=A0A5A8C6F7_CAFRO|nr:hypothetical protein FNF29_06793 [Cafeteria roenbergensis]|eukprot:KAA0148257.1 hypothetical protein FNF29_06793 [Cafeteria roenbergensis]